MALTYNINISELGQQYFPQSVVKKSKNTEMIIFTWHQMMFDQNEIVAFWRMCNHYHLKPVAVTFLGKIKAIKIIHQI